MNTADLIQDNKETIVTLVLLLAKKYAGLLVAITLVACGVSYLSTLLLPKSYAFTGKVSLARSMGSALVLEAEIKRTMEFEAVRFGETHPDFKVRTLTFGDYSDNGRPMEMVVKIVAEREETAEAFLKGAVTTIAERWAEKVKLAELRVQSRQRFVKATREMGDQMVGVLKNRKVGLRDNRWSDLMVLRAQLALESMRDAEIPNEVDSGTRNASLEKFNLISPKPVFPDVRLVLALTFLVVIIGASFLIYMVERGLFITARR